MRVSIKARVLSIDGGGIRGVIAARILIHIEGLLQELSGDVGVKISDYFDLVAGTSTGGILTALTLAPDDSGKRSKYTAQEMLDLYVNHGEEIFTKTFKSTYLDRLALFDPLYGGAQLEGILKGYLGDMKLSELVRPYLIPTYNMSTGMATFFSGVDSGDEDVLVRDVLRMTSAAPTYFPPMQHEDDVYIDGGLFANNPALCGYIEATKFPLEPLGREIMTLSIGTGSIKRKYDYKQVKKWGRLEWIKPVIDIYASAASQIVDHHLNVLYSKKDLESHYLRIEPNLNEFKVGKGMDFADEENIKALIKVGDAMCEKYDKQLRIFIKKLYQSNLDSPHENLYKSSRVKNLNLK